MSKAHKSLLIVSIFALVAAAAFFAFRPAPAKAQKKNASSRPASSHRDDGLDNYDIRTDRNASDKIAEFRGRVGKPAETVNAVRDRQRSGVDTLRRRVLSLKVDYSDTLKTPEVIGPDVRDGKRFLTKSTAGRHSDALKNFISSNSSAVGLDPTEVATLKTVADYTNPDGKLSFVELEQDINGIPVFQGRVKAGFTKSGEMIRVVNGLAPGLAGTPLSTDFGDPAAAATAAASHINVDPGTLDLVVNSAASTDEKQVLGQGSLAITAEKMYFPTEPGVVVPAWRVMLWENGRAFYVIVDAATGTMLWRKNLTDDQSQSASYMVYTNPNSIINAPDSPYPLTPGTLDPSLSTQGTGVSRSLVTLVGNEAPYTFNQLGWITDGGNTTAGNNVQAGLDRKLPNGTDSNGNPLPTDIDPDGMATGSPSRVFNYAFNPGNPATGTGDAPLPSGQSAGTCLAQSDVSTPTAYQQAVVTQLFYLMNRYHDAMYQLGFTEAAGNFQNTNFTGQGLGGDRVSAQAQDCGGTGNANFTTPADGSQPTMQMYLWPSTTGRVTLDGSLDADVVLHEATHGLSNRLHGNGSGLSTNMAAGMGEGISDFYARSLLAEPSDPVQGIYTVGAYVTSNSFADRSTTGNSYYGIRRYPLDVMSHTGGVNNKPHNALTFSYINSNCNTKLNNTNFAFPRSPLISAVNPCDEVHNIGEIWATMLWECRAKFIARLGAVAGNQRMLQLVTDGMKLAPPGPTFITERDAIIAAAVASGDPNDVADLWSGFAIRGLGASASITTAGTGSNNAQVTDGFDLPNLAQSGNLTVSDLSGDADGFAEPGETINVTVPVTNNTGRTAIGVTASLVGGGTASYGTLTGTQTVTRTISFTVPANTTCGAFLSITVNVNSTLGPTSFTRQIFVGKPATTVPTQNFDGVTAPTVPSGWTVTTEQGGTAFVNSTLSADTAPNAMFAADPTSVGGATDLTSPIVSVTSSTATLTFRHSYNTEFTTNPDNSVDTWDGGVLEISIGNGAFQDFLAAGGSFTQNGYNVTLGGGNNNPLVSRAAWGKNSGGFITTVAQLPASANGKLAQFRWRFGADDNGVGSGTNPGWFIDTVSLAGAGFVNTFSCQVTTSGATGANVSGRVVTPGGFGIRGVRVTLTDASNNIRMAVSDGFGYFLFSNVATGQNVTFNAAARGRAFSAKTVQVTASLAEVDLISTQ